MSEKQTDQHVSLRDQLTYNAKHVRLRGSERLKYPLMSQACKVECGHGDDKRHDHRCVLAVGHEGTHEWSSECRGMDWR